MLLKPHKWNVSSGLVHPSAVALWKDVAFIAPMWRFSGKDALLNGKGKTYLTSPTPTLNGTLWKQSPYGLALGSNNSSESRRILYADFAPISTSDGAGTGDFTLMILANPRSATTRAYALVQRYSGAADPHCSLAFNCSSTGINTAGSFAFLTYYSAYSGIAAASQIDGNWHLFAGRRSGSDMTAWRDGVLVASSSLTVRNVRHSSSEFCIGGFTHNATLGMPTTDDIALAAAWNRALSDAEIRLLARDPFIMLRDPRYIEIVRHSLFNPPAAGGNNLQWKLAGGQARLAGQGGLAA